MTKKETNILLLIIGAIIFLPMAASGSSSASFIPALKSFLPSVEGFSPSPIWDIKQWSWGYGTAAGFDKNKKPTGTISREKAWADSLKVIDQHYSYLKKLIKVPLTGSQWAALLSFSYNLGTGNADNLVKNINNQDEAALLKQWRLYVIADGKRNQGLVNRREKEIALWNE